MRSALVLSNQSVPVMNELIHSRSSANGPFVPKKIHLEIEYSCHTPILVELDQYPPSTLKEVPQMAKLVTNSVYRNSVYLIADFKL